MDIRPLKLHGTYEVIPQKHGDHRGYFAEMYKVDAFTEAGLTTAWVQENQSLSAKKGILRGLHFQRPPMAQTKLVRCITGRIWDAFVDLRTDLPTYGQWDAVELDAERLNMVYVPRGFGHGFCTLTTDCLVAYKVDNPYSAELDGGIRWNDPDVGVEWPVADPILSEKDQNTPFLKDWNNPW